MKSNTHVAVAVLQLAMMASGIAAAGHARPVSTASAPRVQLAQGSLVGTTHGGVRAFLGIPYAQPPVGKLRWRAPLPAPPWQGSRAATTFAANCMQGAPAPLGPWTAEFLIDPRVDEDCLYLNVWAPAQAKERLLPVMVWIHGGGFVVGSGSVPIYNGSSLASKGAVVVTINYRLGPFGFLAHPGLSAESPDRVSGNYGLLDVIESLKWVHANIAAFGGDPGRVTIAGQSAGAAVVLELMGSPRARGLFVGAIAESGVLGTPLMSLHDAELDGEAWVGRQSLEDLRAMPPGEVLAIGSPEKAGESSVAASRIMRPIVDGSVLAADPSLAGARLESDVPLLTGYNADEVGGVAPHAVGVEELESRVRADFREASGRLLGLYPHENDAQADATWRQLNRDADMADLLAWCARRAAAGGGDTFAYRFDHALPGPESGRFRSFHSAEVPYVFGVLDEATRPYGTVDRRLVDVVQAYWLGFIGTGAPSHRPMPQWPACTANETRVMVLGPKPALRQAVSTRARLRALQGGPAP